MAGKGLTMDIVPPNLLICFLNVDTIVAVPQHKSSDNCRKVRS